MKKIIYLLIAVLVFGGVAFVLTQTSLLKGEWTILGDQKTVENVSENLDFSDLKTEELVTIPNEQTKTDLALLDTDKDGLSDQDEESRGTDSHNPDTDGDGLMDGLEVNIGTDPLNKDTDNGGLKDGEELSAHKDPLDETDDTDTTNADVPGDTNGTENTEGTGDETESDFACFELNIKPEVYELRRENEDVTFKVDLTIDEKTATSAWNASYFRASALDLLQGTRDTSTNEIDTLWEGTLEVKSDGNGTFTDPSTGATGVRLEIPVTYYYDSLELVYSGGDAGDTIYATILEEETCQDEMQIVADQTKSKVSYVCSDLQITPETYTLPTGETYMDFEVEVTSEEETDVLSWKTFFKNLMAFALILPPKDESTEEWSGDLLVETDGAGTLSTPSSDTTGSSILLTVGGSNTKVPFKYENAVAGETIMASIVNEEKECTDTITLSAEAVEKDEPEDISTEEPVTEGVGTEEVVTDVEDPVEDLALDDEVEETTSSTTSSLTSDDYSFEEILTSKDYICTEPFGDVKNVDWFYGNFCRLYQGGIVQGYSYAVAGPEKNITRAEAIKVLLLLAGHNTNEAKGKTESYSDVSSKDWFYDYYVIAEQLGIVHGSNARPNDPITRGDFMVTMTRLVAADTDGKEGTLYGWDENDIPFSDLSKSDYYTYAIIIGYNTIVEDPDTGETRVFNGYNGTSGATTYIARSEAMALSLRFYLAWYAE